MGWNTYQSECPGCHAEIVRHDRRRYVFCPECGTFLNVPPYNKEEAISVHLLQLEKGAEKREITLREYINLWEAIEFFSFQDGEGNMENFCPKCASEGRSVRLERRNSQRLGEHEVCVFCQSLFDLCPACRRERVERQPFPETTLTNSHACVCGARLIVPVDPTRKIVNASRSSVALGAEICA